MKLKILLLSFVAAVGFILLNDSPPSAQADTIGGYTVTNAVGSNDTVLISNTNRGSGGRTLTVLAYSLAHSLKDLGNTNAGDVIKFAAGRNASGSNAMVGGSIYLDTLAHTNHSTVGSFTNLANVTIPAHTLTNDGDSLVISASGSALTGTNQIQFGYGSQTNILDTGAAHTNLGLYTWRLNASITRLGNTSQRIDAVWSCNPGGGVPFSVTNSLVRSISETNGIANVLKLAGQSIRPGGITNDFFEVLYRPAYR